MMLTNYLVNSLWQVPIIALATRLIVSVVRADVRLRYQLWVACLTLCVILPAVPRTPLPTFHARPVTRQDGFTARTQAPSNEQFGVSSMAIDKLNQIMYVILFLYYGSIAVGAIGIAFGLWRIVKLIDHGMPTSLSPQLDRRFRQAARTLAIQSPELRSHRACVSPATAGFVAPIVLLPVTFMELHIEDASAALCHELMHVKRKDFFWNLLFRLCSLPLLYHPVVHWIRSQIELSREMVCDEGASQLLNGKQMYANSLLAVGLKSRRASQGLAVGWFTTHPLEDRIMQLLKSNESSTRHNPWTAGACATVLIAICSVLTFGSASVMNAQSSQAGTIVAVPSNTSTPEGAKNTIPPKDFSGSGKGKKSFAIQQHADHKHRWMGADGQEIVILNASPDEPSLEERQRIEKTLDDTKHSLGNMQDLLATTNLRLKTLDSTSLQRATKGAEAALQSHEFKQQMSDFEKQLHDGELSRKLLEAQKVLDSVNLEHQQS